MPSKISSIAVALSLGMQLATITTAMTDDPTTANATNTTTTTTTTVQCKNGGDVCSFDAECCGNSALGNCYTRDDGVTKFCEPCWMVCGNGYQCQNGYVCPRTYTTAGPLVCCQPVSTTTTTTTTTGCARSCRANYVGDIGKYTNQPGTGCNASAVVSEHCEGLPNGITAANVDRMSGCCSNCLGKSHCSKPSDCGYPNSGKTCPITNQHYTACCENDPNFEANCQTHWSAETLSGCQVCKTGYAKSIVPSAHTSTGYRNKCQQCSHDHVPATLDKIDYKCPLGMTNFENWGAPTCCQPIRIPGCVRLMHIEKWLDKNGFAVQGKVVDFTNGDCMECSQNAELNESTSPKSCNVCPSGVGFTTRRRSSQLPAGVFCPKHYDTIGDGVNKVGTCPGGYVPDAPEVMTSCTGCCSKCASGVSAPYYNSACYNGSTRAHGFRKIGETGRNPECCEAAPCNKANSNKQPGTACACNDGYSGTITWQSGTAKGSCVAAACNIAGSNKQAGRACACADGFLGAITWSGATPSGTCTAVACSTSNSNMQPGPACACNDGFTGSITWSGSTPSGECTPAACDIGNSSKAPGLACACASGFNGTIQWTGSTPSGTCTAAACSISNSNMQAGPACTCADGFLGEITWEGATPSGTCTAAACNITNSNMQAGLACKCAHGYAGTITWRGATPAGTCAPASCSMENSNMQAGAACACKDGYTGNISWNGDTASGTCSPVACSIENSNMQAGPACACAHGYSGQITWSGSTPIGTCTAAKCEVENSNKQNGTACACADGFNGTITWRDATPSGTCTAAACDITNSNMQAGPACSCADGFAGTLVWRGSTPSGTCDAAACNIDNSNKQAGSACACANGFSGAIKWSGSTPSGTCTAVACSIENSNMQAGPACACAAGYSGTITWDGATASGTCAADAVEGATVTPVSAQVKTTVKMNVEVNAAAGFKDQEFKSALATKLGVDTSKVVIESKKFVVSTTYTLSGKVTEAQAKNALATAWGVQESDLTVIIGSRRLNEGQLLALSTTSVTAKLTTEEASTADDAKGKFANVTSVEAELQKSVSGVTVVVRTPAVVTVEVQSKVTDDKTLTRPSAEELGAIATAAGGTQASISSFDSVMLPNTAKPGASTTGHETLSSSAKPGTPACFIFAVAILFTTYLHYSFLDGYE